MRGPQRTQHHQLDLVMRRPQQSVAVKGSEWEERISKECRWGDSCSLAGSRRYTVTIIGITDHSFSQPYILFSATDSDDPGYFGERLGAARNQLSEYGSSAALAFNPSFASTESSALYSGEPDIRSAPSGGERRRLGALLRHAGTNPRTRSGVVISSHGCNARHRQEHPRSG